MNRVCVLLDDILALWEQLFWDRLERRWRRSVPINLPFESLNRLYRPDLKHNGSSEKLSPYRKTSPPCLEVLVQGRMILREGAALGPFVTAHRVVWCVRILLSNLAHRSLRLRLYSNMAGWPRPDLQLERFQAFHHGDRAVPLPSNGGKIQDSWLKIQ